MESEMKKLIESILTNTKIKHSVLSLKEFEKLLIENNYKKDTIDDFIYKTLFALYIAHFNLYSVFGMKKPEAEGDEE